MFKTENCGELDCNVYYKPTQKVSKISLRNNKIHSVYISPMRKKLMYLFTYKIKDETYKKLITDYIHKNHNLNDKDIYEGIKKILKNYEISEDNKRGEYRIESITKYISNWDTINPTFYLDIGCFKGDITKTIGSYFKLNKYQIHGIDIKQYINTDEFIYTVYDGINIPYNDNSFDLITCFMILHHVPPNNLMKLLAEIFRVMKPNGIILLREHNASPKDYYVLDILHEYYDYVLNSDDVWEESQNYYNTVDFWANKFKKVGFVYNTIPNIRPNNPKNPFNNYIASFRKPDIKKEKNEFFRILKPDFPRERYERRHKDRRDYIHWGQRKLLLSEIEFLVIVMSDLYESKLRESKLQDLKKLENIKIVVIYVGSAPGTHISILHDMFPDIYFILYDPRDFSNTISDIKNIEIHQEYFTDETCHTLKKRFTASDKKLKTKTHLLLISDIRTADVSTMTNDEIENHVIEDQKQQLEWHNIIMPAYSMLKFRLPWSDGLTSYLEGDIYIQAYAPLSSTETRLIVKQNAKLIEYDNRKYEEQMFYFNKYLRGAQYDVSNFTESGEESENKESENKESETLLSYDKAAEVYILSKYNSFCRKYNKPLYKNIDAFSNKISAGLSESRTLTSDQPLPYTKKELVKKLISKGLVPPNIKFTISDYNLYVLPIYDNLIKLGL